ncbi:hypothetical protein HOF92_06550, partial [bacterium]|nr:hypothetical protein [bacterium]
MNRSRIIMTPSQPNPSEPPSEQGSKLLSVSHWFKAVNLASVFGIIGKLLIGLSFTMCIPLGYSIIFSAGDWQAFTVSAVATLLVGLLLTRLMDPSQEIYHREGFAVVALVWVFFSICGSLPYMLAEPHHSFTDAIFETMSGFTTTGATIFTDIASHSRPILLWRSITQWLGGMGII